MHLLVEVAREAMYHTRLLLFLSGCKGGMKGCIDSVGHFLMEVKQGKVETLSPFNGVVKPCALAQHLVEIRWPESGLQFSFQKYHL